VCPPADKSVYLDRIRKAKAYGFNYTKSACEIFFREFLDAADELGYLVCQEMPFGVNGELRALRNDPPAELIDLWQHEVAHIVTDTRSHPSVVCYSMASEMDIDIGTANQFNVFSRILPGITRRLNPHALLFDTTAGFCRTVQTRHGRRDTDLLEDVIENNYSLTPLTGPLPVPDSVERPFFMHEWNWISGMPDPALLKRYASLPLAPVQIPEMIAAAEATGLIDELPAMVEPSRKLKYVLRKDALEQAVKHPKIAGYHGWLIHDVCYCPEGTFNEFWEEPADLSAEEYRTYNNDTVITLEDGDRRSFTYGERPSIGVTVNHFGESPVEHPVVRWQLVRQGKVLAEGSRQLARIACGRRIRLPRLNIPRFAEDAPAQIELLCELWEGSERKVCWNHWPLWFFPALNDVRFPGMVCTSLGLPAGFRDIRCPYDPLVPKWGSRVFVTNRLLDGKGDPIEGILQFIQAGGRALVISNGEFPETYSAFYRTVPYVHGREGNMGTIVHPHPALGDFPHEGWCDLPFVPLIQGACPMRLDAFLPQRITPIIRSIPHPVTMTDKAYLFEVGIGSGTLLVCSLNISTHWHTDPAARYLLFSMLRYLSSETCTPKTVLTADQIKTAWLWKDEGDSHK